MMTTTSTGMTCSEEDTNAETARPSRPETKATAQQHAASSRPGLPNRMASDGWALSMSATPTMMAVCTVTMRASMMALATR